MAKNSDVADTLQLRLNQLDEGLGTAYERYALNRFLVDFAGRYGIHSVVEVPANGVMGVPGIKSMILSASGVSVTLVNPSKEIIEDAKRIWRSLGLSASFVVSEVDATPFKDDSFDLAWNFCCFEHLKEPAKAVSEMKRCTSKYTLIEVQNIFNVGFILHSLYHKLRGEPWDHGEMESMDWRKVKKIYDSIGLESTEVDGNDMPPWPDINMKMSEVLSKETKKDEGQKKCGFRPDVKTKTVEEILSLWSKPPKETPSSPRMLFIKTWHDAVEKITPKKIRLLLCHHPYVVGVKKRLI